MLYCSHFHCSLEYLLYFLCAKRSLSLFVLSLRGVVNDIIQQSLCVNVWTLSK